MDACQRGLDSGISVIILIAVGGNNVRLDIDINGDGQMDDFVDTTWDEITADAGG